MEARIGVEAKLHMSHLATDETSESDPVESTRSLAQPVSILAEPADALVYGTLSAESTATARVRSPHRAKVARLRKSLHRVLFSPGVHFIRDPRTGVQNFDAALEDIPPPEKFAFHRCPTFLPPSKDTGLAALAQAVGCQFVGSTSSLTQAMSHIYFALSDFTAGASLPASLILRPLPDHPTVYAVDSDKSYDVDNVLSDYGRVLEKVLTSEDDDFKRFLNSAPESAVSARERNEREAYSYCRAGSMLMRSQLDCRDSRLPGSGVFDIKTRACFPIRHDRANFEANSAYDISTERGMGATFERELYDLARSGMLKYSSEMDEKLFGSAEVGDIMFGYCAAMLEIVFKHITSQVSGSETSIILRQSDDRAHHVDVAFYPVSDPTARKGFRLNIENMINGEIKLGKLSFDRSTNPSEEWTTNYTIRALEDKTVERIIEGTKKKMGGMAILSVPEGKTVQEMTTATEAQTASATPSLLQWKNPSRRIITIREQAKESGKAYEARKATWRNWVTELGNKKVSLNKALHYRQKAKLGKRVQSASAT